MSEIMNGDAAAIAEEEAPVIDPNAPDAAQQAKLFLMAFTDTSINICVKGTLMSLPAFVPRDVVSGICRNLGKLVGTIFSGSLADVLMARSTCREAFLEGLKATPPPTSNIAGARPQQPMPGPPPGSMTPPNLRS